MEAQKERWEQLCELARLEQDPVRFLEIIEEINRLLEQKGEAAHSATEA